MTAPAGKPGDVLLAASDPGGIVLHRLQRGEDLLLTSGAYMAGDASVEVTSEVQSNIGNSLLSGTGFFLMRARGAGVLALAAHGARAPAHARPRSRCRSAVAAARHQRESPRPVCPEDF